MCTSLNPLSKKNDLKRPTVFVNFVGDINCVIFFSFLVFKSKKILVKKKLTLFFYRGIYLRRSFFSAMWTMKLKSFNTEFVLHSSVCKPVATLGTGEMPNCFFDSIEHNLFIFCSIAILHLIFVSKRDHLLCPSQPDLDILVEILNTILLSWNLP